MKYFIFTLAFITSLNAKAQFKEKSNFTYGKVITAKDTINCFIEQFVDYNSKKIKYKIDKDDDEILKIESSEVYHIKISTIEYDRVISDKKSYLMKSIKKGSISLYNHTIHFQRSTGPNMMGGGYEDEKVNLFIVKKDKTIKLKKKTFKKELKQFMLDNPIFHSEIDKLNFKSTLFEYHLKKLISKYNYWFKYKKKN